MGNKGTTFTVQIPNFLHIIPLVEDLDISQQYLGQPFTYISSSDTSEIKDSYIRATSSSNYGTSGALYVGETNEGEPAPEGWEYVSLIKFKLPSVSSEYRVKRAALNLYSFTSASQYTLQTVRIYRCLKNWTETGVTWFKYDGVNNWSSPGARSSQDMDTTNILGEKIIQVTQFDYKIFQLDITEIQKVIDGTYENYGFVVAYGVGTSLDDLIGFQSSESTILKRPRLEIDFEK
jgi:hypothetical protein